MSVLWNTGAWQYMTPVPCIYILLILSDILPTRSLLKWSDICGLRVTFKQSNYIIPGTIWWTLLQGYFKILSGGAEIGNRKTNLVTFNPKPNSKTQFGYNMHVLCKTNVHTLQVTSEHLCDTYHVSTKGLFSKWMWQSYGSCPLAYSYCSMTLLILHYNLIIITSIQHLPFVQCNCPTYNITGSDNSVLFSVLIKLG